MFRYVVCATLCCLMALPVSAAETEQKQQLGMQLFFDVSLSANRTQSCATCHQPDRAFIDPRGQGVEAAASRGDDGHSLGDRNTPTAAYAARIPAFHRKET